MLHRNLLYSHSYEDHGICVITSSFPSIALFEIIMNHFYNKLIFQYFTPSLLQVLKKKIQVFRAADPGLVHIFHHVDCDHNLVTNQYQMCQGTRYSTYGATHSLAKTIIDNPEILAYKRRNS